MASKESKSVPLIALSIETQVMLSNLLNPQKIIPTESCLPRDWRGIAELATVPSELMASFETKADPFKEVLNFLTTNGNIKLEMDDLKAFLSVIDRYDVLEDAELLIERDILSYVTKINEIALDRFVETVNSEKDSRLLTYEDTERARNGLGFSRYDAFILYADSDAEFANEIIQRMEVEYHLKLCSRDRDLLPGLRFEHEVIGNMIEDRCNRLLVIFSPSFQESNANQFLVSYAQAVALDTRCRKIIPCIYKKCELPVSVRYSFCIDYNRSSKLWNFWDKLSQSLTTAKSNSSPSLNMKTLDCKPINDPIPLSQKSVDNSDWWEADKAKISTVSNDENFLSPPTTPSSSANGLNHRGASFDDKDDVVSIHSQAHLLPSNSSSNGLKSPKWFSKIMNPMKQKKSSKEKNKLKEKAIAE